MSATTWALWPASIEATDGGSNVTCHPDGGVAVNDTWDSGAVPVLETVKVSLVSWSAWPLRFRRPSAVAASSAAAPVTLAASWIEPDGPFWLVTWTLIGYWPLATPAGGVAVTVTLALSPPAMVTVFALAWAAGETATVHPSGPVPAKLNVTSAGVSFTTVSV